MDTNNNTPSRRNFLMAAGAAAGGLLLGGCGSKKEDPFHLDRPPVKGSYRRGEVEYVATACGQCAAGCSIRARKMEGRLIKIEGNAACPINSGGIGPRGLAGVQVVYDPDRIHQPLLRVGPRGEPNFEPIAWDKAIQMVADRLAALRPLNATHRAAIVCGRERGMMRELFERFARSVGTPNFFDGFSHANAAQAQAFELLTGHREMPAYDWKNAQYILSLDSGLLESSCQSVYFTRAQADQRRSRSRSRAKIVHAGQAMTRTGINADEVLPIRPGTCGALALGLCQLLVTQNLYDRDYVAAHVHGFEIWTDADGVEHPGFRSALENFTPAFVQEHCGVDGKTLTRIAEDLVHYRPSFAITGPEAILAPNGFQTAWATLALNTLLGAIHRPGGVLVQLAPPLSAWDIVDPDAVAKAGLDQPRLDGAGSAIFPLATSALEALPEALLSGLPYTLDTLLLYYSNPLYSKINPTRWRNALKRVPFIVTFSPFMDETAAEIADLILPDATYLERWEDAAPQPATGYPVFGLRQPVLREPQHETLPTGDALIAVAKALGGATAKAFAFKDFKDAMLKRVIGIFKAKRGSIVEANGGVFLTKLNKTGFWIDETYPYNQWENLLKTPSGKIELYSQILRQRLRERAEIANQPLAGLLANYQLAADFDRACLPNYTANLWHGDPHEYPLQLIPYKPNTYAEGSGANLPLLQELPLYKGRPLWTTEAQMNPDTAQAYGIAEGDRIEIQSAVSAIQVLVQLSNGILPGVVRVPQGGGHTAFGRAAIGHGANVMRLLSQDGLDPLSGVSPLVGTRVRVRKVTL